jgi:hypothetical protein
MDEYVEKCSFRVEREGGLAKKPSIPKKYKEAAAFSCPKHVSSGENVCGSENHSLGFYKGSVVLSALMSTPCTNDGNLEKGRTSPPAFHDEPIRRHQSRSQVWS